MKMLCWQVYKTHPVVSEYFGFRWSSLNIDFMSHNNFCDNLDTFWSLSWSKTHLWLRGNLIAKTTRFLGKRCKTDTECSINDPLPCRTAAYGFSSHAFLFHR